MRLLVVLCVLGSVAISLAATSPVPKGGGDTTGTGTGQATSSPADNTTTATPTSGSEASSTASASASSGSGSSSSSTSSKVPPTDASSSPSNNPSWTDQTSLDRDGCANSDCDACVEKFRWVTNDDGEKGCLHCSDEEYCLECPKDVGICTQCVGKMVAVSGKCEECPENCLMCSDTESCEQCEPFTKWNKADAVCEHIECGLGCDKCLDETHCALCKQTSKGKRKGEANLLTDDGKCVTKCPNGFEANTTAFKCQAVKEVVVKCPAGQFKSETTGECQACGANCEECVDASTCTTCAPTFHKTDTFECACPDGTALVVPSSGGAETCEPCADSGCASCPESKDICTKCKTLFLTEEGKCVTACPTGFRDDAETKTCEACPENCASCDLVACTGCQSSAYLFGEGCYTTCPAHTFPQELEGKKTCVSCPTGCTECTSASTCTACDEPNYKLEGGACVRQCKDGEVHDGTACKPCPDGCSRCETDMTCTECQAGRLKDGATCPTECPAGKVASEDLKACVCTLNCAVCNADNTCDKCGETFFRSFDRKHCLIECPLGEASDGEGGCKPEVSPITDKAVDVRESGSTYGMSTLLAVLVSFACVGGFIVVFRRRQRNETRGTREVVSGDVESIPMTAQGWDDFDETAWGSGGNTRPQRDVDIVDA